MGEWLNTLWLRARALWRSRQLDRDLDDEVAFHLEMKERAYREQGVDEGTAHARAARQFGNALLVKESLLDLWGWGVVDRAWQDLRFGTRLARRQPGFTAIVVTTLALGIGATTAMFTIVDAVMLRPFPFPAPDRLVVIWETNLARDITRFSGSVANYVDWQQARSAFSDLGAWEQRTENRTDGALAEQVNGAVASSAFFRALGITPALGRFFRADEDESRNRFVVVLGHEYWWRSFGGDPGVLGRSITLNGEPHEIVGVMPPLRAPFVADTWRPLAPNVADLNRGDHSLIVAGRLAAGQSMAQAEAELQTIAARLAAEYPETNMGWSVRAESLFDAIVTLPTRRAMAVLMGAVGLLLLIACVNVANLMLARSMRRQREVSTRLAIGASRGRVVRQLLVESAVLSVAGGAAGLLVATWGLGLVEWLYPGEIGGRAALDLNGYALAFTIAVTMATTLVVGILPALRLSRGALDGGLVPTTRMASDAPRTRQLRNGLVVAEVALALVLLIGAGLLLRSLDQLRQEPLGFVPDGVVTAKLGLYGQKYESVSSYVAFIDRLMTDLQQQPAVAAAGISSSVPFGGGYTVMQARADAASAEAAIGTQAGWRVIGGDYLGAMGVALEKGRAFNASDDQLRTPRVTIINQVLAERLWPGQDPIGRRMLVGDGRRAYEVVGVTSHSRLTLLGRDPEPVMYFHYRQFAWASMTLAVRAAADTGGLERMIRAAVADIDREQPVADVRLMADLVAGAAATPRMNAAFLTLFAVLALALATIGVYGVMSYSAAQRTGEIGVRLALGAQPIAMFGMILLHGVRLSAAGLGAGLLIAVLMGRTLRSLLYEVSMIDPITYAVVFGVMTGVTLIACYVPARRAMRTDPSVALRHE